MRQTTVTLLLLLLLAACDGTPSQAATASTPVPPQIAAQDSVRVGAGKDVSVNYVLMDVFDRKYWTLIPTQQEETRGSWRVVLRGDVVEANFAEEGVGLRFLFTVTTQDGNKKRSMLVYGMDRSGNPQATNVASKNVDDRPEIAFSAVFTSGGSQHLLVLGRAEDGTYFAILDPYR